MKKYCLLQELAVKKVLAVVANRFMRVMTRSLSDVGRRSGADKVVKQKWPCMRNFTCMLQQAEILQDRDEMEYEIKRLREENRHSKNKTDSFQLLSHMK